MNLVMGVVLTLLILGAFGFLYVAWTARSLVGSRWVPHLAFAWLFVPLVVMILGNLALVSWNEPGPARASISRVFHAGVDFSRYAILALMLYLIARRLPEGSQHTERDAEVENGG